MTENIIRFNGEITESDITNFIQVHMTSVAPRLKKLKEYYLGNHDILTRVYTETQNDARLVNNFPKQITEIASNYFIGSPVTYSCPNEKAMELINNIYRFNDEADTNAIHGENISIYGKSYEILYVNKEDYIDTRFIGINPESMFCVYDYELNPNVLCAVRYYYDENNEMHVEYYNDKVINYYKGDIGGITLTSSIEHFFGDVPVLEIINNNNMKSDFEDVLSLIDAYNTLESDSLNEFEYFSDAYLFLCGATIDNETAINMKENRIINIDSGNAKAEFLTKDINNDALESYKDRLVNNIYTFSSVPNLADENFVGNSSGVALKYKLLALENLANAKERKFKKGLQRRLELLFNLLYTRGLIGTDVIYTDVEMTFSRTLPANLVEEAEIARNLQGIVSNKTLLSNLSIVDDVSAEIAKIDEQKATGDAFLTDAFAKTVIA